MTTPVAIELQLQTLTSAWSRTPPLLSTSVSPSQESLSTIESPALYVCVSIRRRTTGHSLTFVVLSEVRSHTRGY